ncbi:MAG: hypothetical protein HW380_3454 [Magnetococcales bacterium]|nr:hypothetical protein [Magnetococcales bacterium]
MKIYKSVRPLVLFFGVMAVSMSGAMAEDGKGTTTMFQEPPSASEILEALGEKPKVKTRGVKTRAIKIHNEGADSFAPPPTAVPEPPAQELANNPVMPPPAPAAAAPASQPAPEKYAAKEPANAYADDHGAVKPRDEVRHEKPAQKPASAKGASVQAKKDKVAMPLTFELGSASLTSEAKRFVDSMGEALKQSQSLTMHISGHTDISGGEAVNRPLSMRRAEAVRDYLVQNHQIDSSRLTVSGEGSSNLLIKSSPKAEQNRRVEFAKVN